MVSRVSSLVPEKLDTRIDKNYVKLSWEILLRATYVNCVVKYHTKFYVEVLVAP